MKKSDAIANGKLMGHDDKVNCTVRKLFQKPPSPFPLLVLTTLIFAQGVAAQEVVDTNSVPASFRPYVHLLGSAEVVAPADGPNWRAMDIKAYDEDRKKYVELEDMVLKVWPRVQIVTVMLDTLQPTFLAGIEAVPTDTLEAHRQEIKDDQAEAKAEKKAEKKEKKARKKAERREGGATVNEGVDKEEDDSISLTIGGDSDRPDTLFMPDIDCWLAMQQEDGYSRTDSLNEEGWRMLVEDEDAGSELGIKEGFLLVHLLDRQNPGMLDFADKYAKAIKLPYWRTIKTFSRLTGYRLNRSYDPMGADGRIEHIIRKHNLDLLDPPCYPE